MQTTRRRLERRPRASFSNCPAASFFFIAFRRRRPAAEGSKSLRCFWVKINVWPWLEEVTLSSLGVKESVEGWTTSPFAYTFNIGSRCSLLAIGSQGDWKVDKRQSTHLRFGSMGETSQWQHGGSIVRESHLDVVGGLVVSEVCFRNREMIQMLATELIYWQARNSKHNTHTFDLEDELD